jgi:hypothetical protein
VFRVIDWDKWSMEERIAFLRSFVEDKARDPMITKKALQIIRQARVPLRDHFGEWAALLRWVQHNVRFTAELKERIQSPQFTLTERYGDCDDLCLVLVGLGSGLRLGYRFVLLGRKDNGTKVCWIEGEGPCPKNVNWHHIYAVVGNHAFRPSEWKFAEPTLDVPLGFDPYKDRVPRDRTDLGATATLFQRQTDIGAVTGGETYLQKIRGHLSKVNWAGVTATVVGGVLSALALRFVVQRTRKNRRRGR